MKVKFFCTVLLLLIVVTAQCTAASDREEEHDDSDRPVSTVKKEDSLTEHLRLSKRDGEDSRNQNENEDNNSKGDDDEENDEYVKKDASADKYSSTRRGSDNSNKYEDGKEVVIIYKQKQNNNKNAYHKQPERLPYKKATNKNKNPYGGDNLDAAGLALVIPAEQNSPQTLDQSYRAQSSNAYDTPYQQQQQSLNQNNPRQQVLLLLKFARDFAQWNPRNNNSQWEWLGGADNAAFVVKHGDSNNKMAYKQQKNNDDDYEGKKQQQYNSDKKDDGYVKMYSVPFARFPANDTDGVYTYNEGVVVTKAHYSIGSTQKFLARMKYACKIINADKNPFPTSAVSDAWNDPRLATCAFQVNDESGSGLLFYFDVTNKGVFAVYSRGGDLNFVAKRLVGIRPRYDSIVDAAVEIDNRRGVVNYYLNGYLVWTIYAVGVPPPRDGVTKTDLGQQGNGTLAVVTSVSVAFGTAKCIDESDPNNQANPQRLVRALGNSTYYSLTDTFYDEESLRGNSLFGQGAILTPIKLLLVRAESILLPPTPLPGVYGPQVPKNIYDYKN